MSGIIGAIIALLIIIPITLFVGSKITKEWAKYFVSSYKRKILTFIRPFPPSNTKIILQ